MVSYYDYEALREKAERRYLNGYTVIFKRPSAEAR